jgi:hypothetical protein
MIANQSDTTTSIIPPLDNGDRLTRDEFERRYAAMPNLKKAELIEGVVYVPAALRYDKKWAYRRNGVRKYLVWRVYDRQLDWFSLEAGEYIKLEPDHEGVMRSIGFPGLWLATPQLLSGKINEVLAVLQQGLNSAEHQEFCQRLAD